MELTRIFNQEAIKGIKDGDIFVAKLDSVEGRKCVILVPKDEA